jgi:hypothetical protein
MATSFRAVKKMPYGVALSAGCFAALAMTKKYSPLSIDISHRIATYNPLARREGRQPVTAFDGAGAGSAGGVRHLYPREARASCPSGA